MREDLCDSEHGEGVVAVQQLGPEAAAKEALEQLGVHQQVVLHEGFPAGPRRRRGVRVRVKGPEDKVGGRTHHLSETVLLLWSSTCGLLEEVSPQYLHG